MVRPILPIPPQPKSPVPSMYPTPNRVVTQADKVRVRRILLVENDDGRTPLEQLPGVTHQDILRADLVITDAGRIIKDRADVPRQVDSYELVQQAVAGKVKGKKCRARYRSIFDE